MAFQLGEVPFRLGALVDGRVFCGTRSWGGRKIAPPLFVNTTKMKVNLFFFASELEFLLLLFFDTLFFCALLYYSLFLSSPPCYLIFVSVFPLVSYKFLPPLLSYLFCAVLSSFSVSAPLSWYPYHALPFFYYLTSFVSVLPYLNTGYVPRVLTINNIYTKWGGVRPNLLPPNFFFHYINLP